MSTDFCIISTKPYQLEHFTEKFPKDQWKIVNATEGRYVAKNLKDIEKSYGTRIWIDKLDPKTTNQLTSGIFEDDPHRIDSIRGIADPQVYIFTGPTQSILSEVFLLFADNEDFYVDDDTENPIVSGAEYVRLIKSGQRSYRY